MCGGGAQKIFTWIRYLTFKVVNYDRLLICIYRWQNKGVVGREKGQTNSILGGEAMGCVPQTF